MVNKVILVGNVGDDPEIIEGKHSDFASLRMATSERWTDKSGEKQERTEWHRVVVYNEALALKVIEPYVKKGSKIYVEGELRTRKYEDKHGDDRYVTEVVLPNYGGKIELLGEGGGSRRSRRDDDEGDRRSSRRRSRDDDDRGSRRERKKELDDEIPF